MNNIHFSSASEDWPTPQEFFQKWNEKFEFDLDVCATPENAKCHRFLIRPSMVCLKFGRVHVG